jgi:hypothetical protein
MPEAAPAASAPPMPTAAAYAAPAPVPAAPPMPTAAPERAPQIVITTAPVPVPVAAQASAPMVAATIAPSAAPSARAAAPPAAAQAMTLSVPSAPGSLGGSAPSTSPETAATGAAVRDYFMRMTAIQATAPSSDTGEFANKLLASAMTGDTSGLDELVRVTEEGANRVRALSPPSSCRECVDYHERMVSMLGESAGMVRQIKTALTSNNAGALTALSASGSSLQARATALEEQAQRIKSQYGVR